MERKYMNSVKAHRKESEWTT